MVSYQYITKRTSGFHGILKTYNKDTYTMEQKSISGYIRSLPDGQQASEDAVAYAKQLGYELPPNKTYVRPFQKYVRKLINVKYDYSYIIIIA